MKNIHLSCAGSFFSFFFYSRAAVQQRARRAAAARNSGLPLAAAGIQQSPKAARICEVTENGLLCVLCV